MASGRSCGSAGCGDDDGTLPRLHALSVDDAPTPVLEDESKSPVPEKGFFHSESPPTPMVEDESLIARAERWGYVDEEGNEKGDMGAWAWAKLKGDFQDSDDDIDICYMVLPLVPGPKKCSLCEGDHYTHDCDYMVRIPPGTKIANTEDYVIFCACTGLSEDGGICDNIDCVSRGVSQDGKSRPWPPRWVVPRDEL